jgi:1-phosphatidylinositol-4-phosphate 5-kinase
MRNVIGGFKSNIMCQYDLKGSSLNRTTELEIDKIERIVMKDNNFEEIEKFLLIEKNEIERLRVGTKVDAAFLNDMEIMDYSLFVVKLSLTKDQMSELFEAGEGNLKDRSLIHYKKYIFKGMQSNIVYIISIIDFLQTYNFYKYLETNIKYYIKSRPKDIRVISSVPPNIYYERFVEYVKKVTTFDINNNKLE